MSNNNLYYSLSPELFDERGILLSEVIDAILPFCLVSITGTTDNLFELYDDFVTSVTTEISSTWFPIKSTIIGDPYEARCKVLEDED